MKLYEDMQRRTGGNVYIGVIGPVRVGKSTFVKRVMEELVLPCLQDDYVRERARDELPQSGSGRTVMTAEPKFVPEEAVEICPDGQTRLSVRMIDSVGYLIPGALGATEDGAPRMVTTPWFDHEIPMAEAAELGTRKVMESHCTVGVVITTDGSVTELPRAEYLQAEQRAIRDMQATGKPFVVLLNTAAPDTPETAELVRQIAAESGAAVRAADLLKLDRAGIGQILQELLGQFPPERLEFRFPSWFDALEPEQPWKREIYGVIRETAPKLTKMELAGQMSEAVEAQPCVQRCALTELDPGSGVIRYTVSLPEALFYQLLSQRSGVEMRSDADLLRTLSAYAGVREEYERLRTALDQVRTTGYGIVMPGREELKLQKPELVKKGGAFGVRLRAEAPSIHLLRADLSAELSPIVGSEQQAGELVRSLTEACESDGMAVWESKLFGKSIYELVCERLNAKLTELPEDARGKLRKALERIVNEGANGLICLVL